MKPVDLYALENLVRPTVEGLGYELVDITWKREQVGWIFRVTVDRKPDEGYISHEDCIRVSHEVSALLDSRDPLPGNFSLEVSSPGLERPLKRPEAFSRFIGRRARIRLRPEAARPGATPTAAAPPAAPRRNYTGRIDAVTGATVTITTDDAERVELLVQEMEKANLLSELQTGPAGEPPPAGKQKARGSPRA